MRRFNLGQRIQVVDPMPGHELLVGIEARVTRLRHCDDGAWCEFSARVSGFNWPFPEGDHRAAHALIYPQECEGVAIS